jgi:AhpD family alkylhydroperoxidase
MDERTKELIAIGASVSAHCQPCLFFHLNKAWELGIGEDEIREAIEVGYMVERGASTAMRKYAGQLLTPAQSQGDACCSGSTSECCR